MLDFVSRCQKELLSSAAPLDYLVKGRGLTMESIGVAELGFFPTAKSFRCPHGVDPLRGMVIVPIRGEFDELVGIAGRVPDPKVKGAWRNTRFTKTNHLYGFNLARRHMFERNKGYVFEGYMDRIVLSQHGLPNNVAVMSANLGSRRIGLVARYCSRICLCFDTDKNLAGKAGMLRTLADLWAFGFGKELFEPDPDAPYEAVTTIKLPVGVDPDDFVATKGLEEFVKLERPVTARLMDAAEKAYEGLKEKMRMQQLKEMAERQKGGSR